MKITDVEAIVLDSGKNYPDPREAAEAHGVRFVSLLKNQHRRGHHRLGGHRDAAARGQGHRRCAIRRRDRL